MHHIPIRLASPDAAAPGLPISGFRAEPTGQLAPTPALGKAMPGRRHWVLTLGAGKVRARDPMPAPSRFGVEPGRR
jgi:hypothetical protein